MTLGAERLLAWFVDAPEGAGGREAGNVPPARRPRAALAQDAVGPAAPVLHAPLTLVAPPPDVAPAVPPAAAVPVAASVPSDTPEQCGLAPGDGSGPCAAPPFSAAGPCAAAVPCGAVAQRVLAPAPCAAPAPLLAVTKPSTATLAAQVAAPRGTVLAETAAAAAVVPDAPGHLRVCVVGADASALSFGVALAQRLVRLPAARGAVVCVWGGRENVPAPRRGGPPAPSARRYAATLTAGGHAATATGRLVRVALPADAAAAVGASAAISDGAGAAAVVTVLADAREAGFDAVLSVQRLVLVVVAADAPPMLGELAVASVSASAPNAAVRVVALPARLAGPARRAAVTRALGALR